MTMNRTLAALMLILLTTTPLALAQENQPTLPEAGTDATAIEAPDAAADAGALADGLSAAAGAASAAGGAIADAAGAAARLVAGAAKAVLDGIAALAQGAWSALTFLAVGVFDAVVFVAGGLWAGLVALVHALGAGLQALGRALAFVGGALGGALLALGSGLGAALAWVGALLADGARWCAAHPRETAVAGASTAGAGGMLYALRRLGWLPALLGALPLYTRLAPGQMLDNEARARVYELIRTRPGMHVSALGEELGLGWGTITYHLQRLEESRLVTSKTVSNRKCYFVTGSELDGDARTAMAAISGDPARRIVDVVRANPHIVQKDLAAALGMSQALASFHVKRLVKAGVLLTQRVGRSNALTVAQHVPLADGARPPAAPA